MPYVYFDIPKSVKTNELNDDDEIMFGDWLKPRQLAHPRSYCR
jgi:hypothetical protein